MAGEVLTGAALAFKRRCEAAGAPRVRVRHATGSTGRLSPLRGTCAACGAEVAVNGDGGCRTHNARPVRCASKAPVDGPCECGRPAPVAARAHDTPPTRCEGSGCTPDVVVPQAPEPDVRSVSVSAVWGAHDYAIGVWWDGRFSAGFTWGPIGDGGATGTRMVNAAELGRYVDAKGAQDLR